MQISYFVSIASDY